MLGTERGEKRKFFNYRYVSLCIGALITSIFVGLSVTPPSFNHWAVAAIVPYMIALYKVYSKIQKTLELRYQKIAENASVLNQQKSILDSAYEKINEDERKLEEIGVKLFSIVNECKNNMAQCFGECESLLRNDEYFLNDFELALMRR